MWQTKLIPGFLPSGQPILSVIAKETYCFEQGTQAVVDTSNPIELYEEDSWVGSGDPLIDAVKHETDLVAYKPYTDVIFIGKAHCPAGKKARFFDLTIAVGEIFKTVRVFGDRKVIANPSGISFTEPDLFENMPLHYGLAYGGMDIDSDPDFEYTYKRNPVGKGFVVKNNISVLHDMVLPNLEDPNQLLTPKNIVVKNHEKWIDMPEPCSFGYISKQSWPRIETAVKPMEKMASSEETQTAQGFVHPSFYNGATPEFQIPEMKGGEVITMMYMDPEVPKYSFTLPSASPTIWLNTGSGLLETIPEIQTVEVYKNTNQVTLVWRGSFEYAGPEAIKDFTALEYGAY
ncbi:MAG: DUF2169 domain-containing protein [Reichenbachiella sp.]